ncbi:MAG: hypothetical protein KDC38_00750 [Planctomycetes bacterium]|nr:hypothetical protein [Planctomycetota bacterium]
MSSSHSLLAILLVIGLSSSAALGQSTYDFTFFDAPGVALTHPYGLNDAGDVVGSYFYGDHGFIRDAAGIFTTVDYPGSTDNSVRSINDLGVAVGAYRVGLDYGFTYESGAFTTLPALSGSPNFVANGINDAGIIVGKYRDSSAQDHGFLFDGMDYFTIDHPAGAHTILNDIANTGVIVGSYWSGGAWIGFTYDGITFTDLAKPGAHWTYLAGINDAGEIVGQEVDISGSNRTAIYYDGVGNWSNLDVPGSTGWTAAQDINNNGVICGYAYNSTFDAEQGFIATPVGAVDDSYIRGDVNDDGMIDVADPVALLAVLFTSGTTTCQDALDANDDGTMNIADVIYSLAYTFEGAAPPPQPFPLCGSDPTADGLGCVGTGCP